MNTFKHDDVPPAELRDGSCDTAWSRRGGKGWEKHIPVPWNGLQTPFLVNGNTEYRNEVCSSGRRCLSKSFKGIVVRYAEQESPLPPHGSLLPCPTALAARRCWGLPREGCFRDNKTFCRSLITASLTQHRRLKCARSIY